MLIRLRNTSRGFETSGDSVGLSTASSNAPEMWRPTTCNNSVLSKAGKGKPQHVSLPEAKRGGENSSRTSKPSIKLCTFQEYLTKEKAKSGFISSKNASESVTDDKTGIMHREALTTFAEYRKRGLGNAATSQKPVPAAAGHQRNSVTLSDTSQLELTETPRRRETDSMGLGVTFAGSQSLMDLDNSEMIDGEDDDLTPNDKPAKGGFCAACCCAKGKRQVAGRPGRRRRRMVGFNGAKSSVANRGISQMIEEDADMADVKDMDPTITLMPYVLFESERHKVLYQSVGMDEAELLKRAIALHANHLYKQMLMRLAMSRYMKIISESICRTILSKKIQFFLNNDALAVNLMGIEIAAEDAKSSSDSSAISNAISANELTFDSPAVELTQSATQQFESLEVSRQMFKSAPRFTDVEVLELLNSGKILDITGRASLESLISLPVTKVGQRRAS